MALFVEAGELQIDDALYRLVRDEIAPGTGVDVDQFWLALSRIVGEPERALNQPHKPKHSFFFQSPRQATIH